MPLHSKKQGQGPALVLLHGLFGSLENLAALARDLQHHYTVYSIDLPNHGRSPHYSQTDLDAMTNTVIEWMAQHKIECAHLVGHSLGGKIAMQVALSKPERVDTLVVMDIAPSKYDPHHHSVFDGLFAVDVENITSRAEADEAMKAHVPELSVRSFLLKNITKAQTGHFVWRMNLPVLHKYYAELIRENADAQFAGATFFIKGGASDYITEKNRVDIEKRFPNASYKAVANVGHWLHAEKPALVARLVVNFLAENS
ncbi:MAG: alpha/beta fold hydrolase [Agarilytica sp.]